MKRHILVFLLLTLAFPLWAGPVGVERASEAARAFFQRDRNVALRLAPIQRVERAAVPLTKASPAEPAFHIFNRAGGGFVIIAAEDACNPVLAYSFTNHFGLGPDMPDGLSAWLDDLEEQVAFAREASASERQQALRKWDAVFVQTKGEDGYKPAVKHDTPTWGQGEPFNNLAPVISGKKAVAGCVPLAMSMLAWFYRYPAAGKGTVPGYTYSTDAGASQSIEGITLGTPYQWDKMKMSYADGYTAEEAAAVAQLVYECGVMVQAKFDSSTSANPFMMSEKAIEFLCYDPGTVGYYRGFFSDEEWLSMLKIELQEHPVLYSANRGDAGHSFVVDGYDDRVFLSVNWGWSGKSNGYYALSAFSPSPERQYLFKHAAIFGLKPDVGGTPVEMIYLYSGTSSSSGVTFNGLEAQGEIIPRHTFLMKVGGICNIGNTLFEGQFILALTDADGHIKDFVCGSQYIDALEPNKWRGFSDVSCILNTYPAPGDEIRCFYHSILWPDNDWRPICFDRTEGTVGAIPVSDNQTLAEATDFAYNKSVKSVTINTKDRVNWSLKSSSGAEVKDCVSYAGVQMIIDAASLKGAYTLTLKRDDDQYSVTLKF